MASQVLSIDTETDSKDPMKANLRVVGVAHSPTDASYFLYPKDKEKIQELLASPLPKVAHNIKFDYKVLVRHGFKINGGLEDTLMMSQMNGAIKKDNDELKTLALLYFNKRHITFTDLMSRYNPNTKKTSWKVDKIPIKALCDHCLDDCKTVYRLYEHLRDTMDSNCLKVYDNIEKPLLKIVIEMESIGLNIDIGSIDKLIEEYKNEMRITKAYCFNLYGSEFNLNASLELEQVLFDKFKYPLINICDNGRPATDEGTLKRLVKGGCILPYYILEYRGLSKILSTYLESYKKKQIDGKLRYNLQQTGTETGRFSSSKPNIQNIHPDVLKVFTASKGNTLLSFDYRQMELVLLANLSKDKVLSEAALAGRDLHEETANRLGVSRSVAKVFNFGIPYRMGAWGIMNNLKNVGQYKSLEECNNLLQKHIEEFSGVEKYAQDMISMGMEKGYVETITGRKRWVNIEEDKAHHFESQCVNSPIQGGCADIIKIAMINIAKYRYIPVAQVHDELIFDVPVHEKEAVIKVVTQCMTNSFPLGIPMRVKVSEGFTWDQLKKND